MDFAGAGSLIGSSSLFATESAVSAREKNGIFSRYQSSFFTVIDCARGLKLNRHFIFYFCHHPPVEVLMDCPHGGAMQTSHFASVTPEQSETPMGLRTLDKCDSDLILQSRSVA